MKKTGIAVIFAFFALNVLNAQTKKEPIISEPVSGMIIDADDIDWENVISYYDEDSGIMYGIANDAANLYILVKATDEMAQRKFVGGGVEVWVSPEGKEKREYGIKYPIPLSWDERRAMRNNGMTREDAQRQSRKGSTYSTMELRGFKNIADNFYTIDTMGINVQYSGESGNSISEYKIPFAEFCNSNQINSDNIFCVGIIINGIQMQNFGGRRGGWGGPTDANVQREMRKMAQSNNIWVYTKLSFK